ncbi:MAG: 3-dehydroquinate synthase [Deltaproteobacteria bacterium]|nr:3-dehydroquinate synthase [Deltaproteobacteria bacterium]
MILPPQTVTLGDRSYPVIFGALLGLGAALAERRRLGPCVVVTNDVVGPLYAEAAQASLRAAGFSPTLLTLPDGEANKTFETWTGLVEALLARRVDRHTPVIALGGGVTGDVVGFAAASVLRGLPLVQVPTTLLAMVDSSVGGKTGVNAKEGKNLIGAFYQPSLVYAAIDTLATLPEDELRCGLGEVVKHGVIDSEALLSALETDGLRVLHRDAEATARAVAECVRVKAAIVSQDEREEGLRAILNLGHTLGHAVERCLGYGAIRHGEAVGLGIIAEARIAELRGEADGAFRARITALLTSLGLPVRCPTLSAEALVTATGMDKKRAYGTLRVAYPIECGRVRLDAVTPEELHEAALVISAREEDR